MKRSYNLEVKLLKDPASKVCGNAQEGEYIDTGMSASQETRNRPLYFSSYARGGVSPRNLHGIFYYRLSLQKERPRFCCCRCEMLVVLYCAIHTSPSSLRSSPCCSTPVHQAHYNLEKSQKDARLTALQTRLDAVQVRSCLCRASC